MTRRINWKGVDLFLPDDPDGDFQETVIVIPELSHPDSDLDSVSLLRWEWELAQMGFKETEPGVWVKRT